MSKLFPTTSLNEAIRRVASGDIGAASIIAMLNSRRPQNVMDYLRALDEKGVYGRGVYEMFHTDCQGNLEQFVKVLSR